MSEDYLIRAGKVVTVSSRGTIHDGGIFIQNGKIAAVDDWHTLSSQHPDTEVIDHSDAVMTPGLVDCHTHLLEFAPTSLAPVTTQTHFHKGRSILLDALSYGTTAIGEQLCGHPSSPFSIDDYRNAVRDFPIDISFAATSITLGFDDLAHFTSITKSQPVNRDNLVETGLAAALARKNDYPGENLFINATPANFKAKDVPRAGEIIYSLDELKHITSIFHEHHQEIGVHVAGKQGIQMALDAGIDVLHHAHAITDKQIKQAAKQHTRIISTPMGGTHLQPNKPERVLDFINKNIPVSVATDAYLPPYPDIPWLDISSNELQGTDALMAIARPIMHVMQKNGYDENDILALITKHPADILRKGEQFGNLEAGKDANIIITNGIPGIETTDTEDIQKVIFQGQKVIER